MLSECRYAECRYAECHLKAPYTECRYAECRGAYFGRTVGAEENFRHLWPML